MTRHTFKTGTFASASILAMAVAGQAQAVTFEQQMQALYQPTFFDNFDFDGDRDDTRTATSAGFVDVGDEHVRGEIRWGATVTAGKTTGKFLLESDAVQNAGQADGDAVNLERAYFTYEVNPGLVLQAGHEFKAPDFAGGGLLYGDDHPIFGVKGDTSFGSYDAYAIIVNDSEQGSSQGRRDSTVFLGKASVDLGSNGTVSPIVAFHNNENVDADITYFGGTYVGGTDVVQISAEAFGAVGGYGSTPPNGINFNNGVNAPAGASSLADDDISTFGANLILEFPFRDAFNPNIGFRWLSGDSDPFDDDLGGFSSITDISGFVGPMSSGHSILRWGPNQNDALSSPVVFGSTFETSGPADGGAGSDGSAFGGIGNSATGTNPGQIVIAPGASGSLTPSLSYQASLWFMWYDETGGLEVLPNAEDSVDDYAGTQLDIRLDYALTDNFTVSASGGVLDPGDGVKDATGADDLASLALVEMKWSY